ncbi:MAG: hypothetical protein HFG17_07480 [Oscillospiraceae bacterium]|nr:hypothetical protein [Oscillospiraceae bacterium]
MSMPSFPPNGANMTREEALTMIIASIAMEELALSHILNAEGEKLQYILGTLPGTEPCACPHEVLSINKSVTALLEAVTQNQMLLKNKLERALEACPHPCPPPCKPEPGPHPAPPPCKPEPGPHPCPPPCRPEPGPHPALPPCKPEPGPHPCPPPCNPEACFKSALQLEGQRRDLLWKQGYCLPWRPLMRRGAELRWNEQNPGHIFLNPGKAYVVQYTLNISTAYPAEEAGTIILKQAPCGAFMEILPLYFKTECRENWPQTLHYAAMLYPCMGRSSEAELCLVLKSPNSLYVEQAIMNIIEL